MLLLIRGCKWIQDNIRLWAATYPYFIHFEIIVYIRKLGRQNHWWTKWGNHPWKNPPHCLFGLGYHAIFCFGIYRKSDSTCEILCTKNHHQHFVIYLIALIILCHHHHYHPHCCLYDSAIWGMKFCKIMKIVAFL